MDLYYNLADQCRCNAQGVRLKTRNSIHYKEKPVWILHVLNGTSPMDLSSIASFRAAIDTDKSSQTEVLCRTTDSEIDHSRAAQGILSIPVNANTVNFRNAVNGQDTRSAYFELWGLNTDGDPVLYIIFDILIMGVVDPDGGAEPEEVLPDYIPGTTFCAWLHAASEFQFSADGSAWHDMQNNADSFFRFRNAAIQGDWSTAIQLPAGSQGPAGPDGHLAAVSAWSSSSAYDALTCLTYQGGGYQVLSATSAGESPDTAPGKFICFASKGADGSNGSDGVTPVISGGSAYAISAGSAPEVSATSSGGIVYFDFGIPAGPKGDPGDAIASANISVSSLTSGAISVTHAAFPVAVKTNLGNLYPIEKRTLTESAGTWNIDPAAYLAYDNVQSFTGPWTVYFAGGLPDSQPIIAGGTSTVPVDHQVFEHTLAANDTISFDTSGLTSSECVTFELWLDMPSTAVSFTLSGVTWISGAAPDFSSGSTRYVIVVRWNGTKLLANLAYTEELT